MKEKIEEFHLIFLKNFSQTIKPDLYAVKGGCNLRYFFESIRYSEDLDLDIKVIAKSTLKNKVDKIIKSQPFQNSLSAKEIAIENFSFPKQTETTQRWKFSLEILGTGSVLNTKIEFSRREMNDEYKLEQVSPRILAEYKFPLLLLSHYTVEASIRQKYNALKGRAQTQARDIFDLNLLLDRGKVILKFTQEEINLIKQNASSISYQDYKSQVISFLEMQYQEIFDTKEKWQEMVSRVLGNL